MNVIYAMNVKEIEVCAAKIESVDRGAFYLSQRRSEV